MKPMISVHVCSLTNQLLSSSSELHMVFLVCRPVQVSQETRLGFLWTTCCSNAEIQFYGYRHFGPVQKTITVLACRSSLFRLPALLQCQQTWTAAAGLVNFSLLIFLQILHEHRQFFLIDRSMLTRLVRGFSRL